MKTLKFIICLSLIIVFTACKEKDPIVDYREKWCGDWEFTTIDYRETGVQPPYLTVTKDTIIFIGNIKKYEKDRLRIEYKPNAKEPDYGSPSYIYGLIYPIIDEDGILSYPELHFSHGGFSGYFSNENVSISYCQTFGHAGSESSEIQGGKLRL